MHFREHLPNGKAQPRLLSRGGGTLGGLHHSWDSKMGGECFHRCQGDKRVVPPHVRVRSLAEEGVLALEKAQQSAVRDGLLYDFLDL